MNALAIEERKRRLARILQMRTQWAYSECLRLVKSKTSEEIEKLVAAEPTRKQAAR